MASQKTIGALLFEGFELLDVFGPLEAWGILASAGGWRDPLWLPQRLASRRLRRSDS